MYAGRVTASLNRCAPFSQFCGLAAVQRIAQQRQLFTFLQGEGEPAFHFRVETGFHAQIDRAVQQGAGRSDPQRTLADEVFNLRIFLGQIGAPDVAPVDQARREQPVGRQTLMQSSHIIFTVHQVNVQALHRQRGDGVEVSGDAFKVGGQQQLKLARERVICRFECIQPRLRQLQYQRRLVNLHPLDAAFCQLCQYLLVNRQDIVQQAQTVKLLAFDFAQPQISDRPQQDRFNLMTERQRFIHFIQQLGPGQFELLPFYKLRHHVVVVGVKPFGHFCRCRRFAGRRTAATNAEQGIDINRAIFVLMTSRHVTQ